MVFNALSIAIDMFVVVVGIVLLIVIFNVVIDVSFARLCSNRQFPMLLNVVGSYRLAEFWSCKLIDLAEGLLAQVYGLRRRCACTSV